MKNLLLAIGLVATLASCSKKEEPAPDLFLGHWQADEASYVEVDAIGRVLNTSSIIPVEYQLDVTSSTLQYTFGSGNSINVAKPIAYTRTGQLLTIPAFTDPMSTYYVRDLTANTFTYERVIKRVDGSVFTSRSPYHR